MAYDASLATPVTGTTVSVADFGAKVVGNIQALAQMKQELPLDEAMPPLSDIAAAAIDVVESSGAAPNPAWKRMLLNATTTCGRQWEFTVDTRYSSSPVLKFHFYMDAANSNSKAVVNCRVAAISDGDTGVTAKVFDAVNVAAITVPNSSGVEDVGTVTITNADSMAAGDRVMFIFYRDPAHASDNALGNMCIVGKPEIQFLP